MRHHLKKAKATPRPKRGLYKRVVQTESQAQSWAGSKSGLKPEVTDKRLQLLRKPTGGLEVPTQPNLTVLGAKSGCGCDQQSIRQALGPTTSATPCDTDYLLHAFSRKQPLRAKDVLKALHCVATHPACRGQKQQLRTEAVGYLAAPGCEAAPGPECTRGHSPEQLTHSHGAGRGHLAPQDPVSTPGK